jgi:1-deoxy-D-xylulose-5-phosphate reductoisomerase
MAQAKNAPRKLIVLGSTGSIGVSTLEVVEHLNSTGQIPVQVTGLAAGKSVDAVIAQAKKFNVKNIAMADQASADKVKDALPGVRVFAGPHASRLLVEETDATDVSAAVVGSAGLPAAIAAVKKGLRIGLANKETLVAAGEIVNPLVKKHKAVLLPVDSEHSAIFQCMEANTTGDMSHVKKIVLTASGGPFRTATKETIENATVAQALKHPTWTMGQKITIDSATMMNKSLEVIEAHWLFDLPAEQIDVIIHPQSIAHSFVEFTDNSILAQMGPPDMKTPILYALTWPHRAVNCSAAMDWKTLSKLEFFAPDHDRFPSINLAYRVIRQGGTSGAIFNAANEIAVAAFLEQRIRFGRIVRLVEQALDAIPSQKADSLETILEADAKARDYVRQALLHEAPASVRN